MRDFTEEKEEKELLEMSNFDIRNEFSNNSNNETVYILCNTGLQFNVQKESRNQYKIGNRIYITDHVNKIVRDNGGIREVISWNS